MQVGTEILLARMKEYPEEFTIDEGSLIGRWHRVIRDARNYLPKEDVEALDEAYRQLHVDKFNERVLKVLAGEDVPEKETVAYKTQERYATGWTDPRMLAQAQQAQNNMLRNSMMKAEGQAIIGAGGSGGLGIFDGLNGMSASMFGGGCGFNK